MRQKDFATVVGRRLRADPWSKKLLPALLPVVLIWISRRRQALVRRGCRGDDENDASWLPHFLEEETVEVGPCSRVWGAMSVHSGHIILHHRSSTVCVKCGGHNVKVELVAVEHIVGSRRMKRNLFGYVGDFFGRP